MTPRRPRHGRRGLADQLRTLIRESRELAEPLDRETFNRRPSAGGWSVAECLEHLNATARLYIPVLTEAIDDARARGLLGDGREGRTMLGRVFTWSQEPPVRVRMKTYEELTPGSEDGADAPGPEAVLEEFEALHEELIVRVNESADLDRRRVRVRSALDRRLKLSLGDWFAFLAAHGRRHLWQAERVLEGLKAPAGGEEG